MNSSGRWHRRWEMARKFSLKDNPIFQRLEVPRRKEQDALPDVTETTPLTPDLSNSRGSNIEGQNKSLKNAPSSFEPQKYPLKEEKVLGDVGDDHSLGRPPEPVPNASQQEKEKFGEAIPSSEESPIPNAEETAVGEEEKIEEQNQTLKYRPSNIDPQDSLPREEIQGIPKSPAITPGRGADVREGPEKKLPEDRGGNNERGAEEPGTHWALTNTLSETEPQASTNRPEENHKNVILEGIHPTDLATDLGLKDNLDKSLFFSFYNEVNDDLLPTLDAAEQILYSRLFRLSYGFNRNYCTVSQPILGEKTGLSRNTIRTGLQSLVQKAWISVIEAGNHIATTYRVYLPREKISGSNFDPQKRTVKNRPANTERHNLSGKFRSSKNDNQEGQKPAVQNSSGNNKVRKFPNQGKHLQPPPPDFDPQKMPSLLITHNSFTLSRRERKYQLSDKQILLPVAQKLVDKFYTLLTQQPSTAKREKSTAECVALLCDGFSVDQIDYAMTWVIAHHPTTGSFSRVAHFIDQALKAKAEEQLPGETENQKHAERERKRLEERRLEEQGKQIDEMKASLSQKEFDTLYQEASRLVENEHGPIRFGRETLIQIKVRELIRVRYLQDDHL
jgi:hypothetical protein